MKESIYKHMLAIRMQRVGRKGHPEFRVVVQDSRLTPTSGRIVARLGHVNPHTKAVIIDKEMTKKYLDNGAQPSPRVVRMLQSEKITLPSWVVVADNGKKRSIKNSEKLRRNRPAEEKVEETPAPELKVEELNVEGPAEESATELKVEELNVESSESEVAETATVTVAEEPAVEAEVVETAPEEPPTEA